MAAFMCVMDEFPVAPTLRFLVVAAHILSFVGRVIVEVASLVRSR